ncbi:MAG: glyoxalase [Rhodospirillales bacterium CG15_BIG_FIL_POST_REV_8_21_14_020_66_15]|nr:MAG: glyoxalase [Rhodospirillales bacterium CG15_BIG_FIL_POST_REV_8_21_14_020_66_15]
MVDPIPDGYTAVTPYLIVDGAAQAIEFYKKALGAVEVMRLEIPDTDRIAHAEITIGGDHVMLTDANPAWGTTDPKALGGITASMSLYVEDADAAQARAVAAGATEKMPVTDMFWGDRMGCVVDPFGHQWSFLTHTRDLSDEEIRKGFLEMMEKGCG